MPAKKQLPKTLTIRRSRWAHTDAEGALPKGDAFLLNGRGGMCCLGFLAAKCGVPRTDRLLVTDLTNLPREWKWIHRLLGEPAHTKAALANDDKPATNEAQEKSIREIFADRGVKVRFTN